MFLQLAGLFSNVIISISCKHSALPPMSLCPLDPKREVAIKWRRRECFCNSQENKITDDVLSETAHFQDSMI